MRYDWAGDRAEPGRIRPDPGASRWPADRGSSPSLTHRQRPVVVDTLVGPIPGLRRLLTGCVVATLAVSLTGCSASSTAPTPARRYIFGQITAEDGPTWVVRGIRGATYTVTVTDLTLFGTMFHPITRDQFKVADNVRIAGDISGTAITATAVDFRRQPHVTAAAR